MVTWMSCIIAIIFNIFVNPIALDAIGWKYYLVYVVILILYGLIVFFFYPETRGYSLEQMSGILDKYDAMDARSVTSQPDEKLAERSSDHDKKATVA